jgi:hypothetical protein
MYKIQMISKYCPHNELFDKMARRLEAEKEMAWDPKVKVDEIDGRTMA